MVFVDESGLAPGDRLAYGYAPRGERCVEAAPLRPKGRLNLLGFISTAGGKIVTRTRRVTKEVFTGFVMQHLVPFLKPGDIVLWDNARIHDSKEAKTAIQAVGADLQSLPRYSPDLSAIEPMWSKTKHFVRKVKADTAASMREALVSAAAMLTTEDIAGWIGHCGYSLNPSA